ncbi:uncharacterized protein LOC141686060 [Apium graveolens]|uniref:uncharacterized protein LOC141686060 n=1 Tax=Apium graveolens TaxID=4045 RepID=UPI003D7A5353
MHTLLKVFEYYMRDLDKVDSRIRIFLEEVGYDKWARVHSPNNKYSNLTSNIAESLIYVIIAIRELPVHLINDVSFEVHNGDRKAIVDIGLRTYTCNRFQLDQLPYDPYDYCSPYFTKETMIHYYEETVSPVGHKDTWKVPKNIKSMKLNPPQGRVRVGRPKKEDAKLLGR